MHSKEKILVTGAAGFIGSALLRKLDSTEFVTYPVARNTSTDRDIFVLKNIDDSTDWTEGLHKCNTVIHLAARVHGVQEKAIDPLAEFRRVNVGGTLNLAQQAAVAGVKRFIFISSVKVNGESTTAGHAFTENDPPSPQDAYGQSKHEAECGLRRIAETSNMEVVIIRPPLVYGPGVKANFAALMRAVQLGWPLPLGAVDNRRSLVSLGNLVDLILVCISHPKAAGQTFMVSDGFDLSTAELVRGLARVHGVGVRLVSVPVWILRSGAALLGKSSAIDRLCGNLQVDISKARNILGWVPPVSVEQGLSRVVSGEGARPV
ncbi:MAG: SDR family oxidoreductase [Rhodoferax sp.]|nr:SDR family oxidoreductase [Rhodoferax sp.]